MSYSRFLLASALVPAALFAFPSSPEAAALSHGHTSAADYTHIHTSTLSAEPASRFIDMAHSYKTAAVCFLGYGDCDPDTGFGSGNADYAIDTTIQCRNEGFSRQNCNSVQVIDGVCPYNSSFGKGCKCADGLVSCLEGQTGVGESCDGKYAKCECVTGVSAGAYGCKEYYPSPCSSVCKTAYTDNCHNRTNNNSAVYGCMKYWSDCSSKCETPYTDNCRNRTAVISGCPANATCTYFSDCSAKISGWSCNTGYKASGNSCVVDRPRCNVGDIFYTDNTCVAAVNHNSSKTVLGIVVYVNSDGVGGQIIAPSPIDKDGNPVAFRDYDNRMAWGPWGVDVSGLKNYGEYSKTLANKEIDSCGNTDILVSTGSAEAYPAAWATRKYAPTSATAGKWCLPAQGVLGHLEGNYEIMEKSFELLNPNESYLSCFNSWTSTEGTRAWAWHDQFCSNAGGTIGLPNKDSEYSVFPVLEF